VSPRVVVGLSGGVDSSVAAALLVEQGVEVIGVTLRLAGGGSRCCSLDDAEDARRVAEQLGVRFYVADHAAEFRREVMEPFADAYLAGRTPIPCVTCNRRFKFGRLLDRARALGAEAVATGHYARIGRAPGTGTLELHRAADPGKDQSYFLFDLAPSQLGAIRFPLGALRKEAVRAHARRLGLATADKPESQEICFVPDGDYARVVEDLRPEALPGPGPIRDASGRTVGRHPGIHHFTVGQRRGLAVAAGRRLYVQSIDAAANALRVAPAEGLAATGARLSRTSWIAGATPSAPLRARVRVRHRHEPAPALVEPLAGGAARVHFDAPVGAVTPGQAAVFYDGDRVLGGGWIEEALA
jgi:tRNA-specific 2-thiouridylase